MNGYVSSHLQGGLGNYLFQISAAYAVAMRDNKELKIDISDIAIIHSPLELYSNNIFRNITFGEIVNFESIHSSAHSPISYLNIPIVNGNLKLDGYEWDEDDDSFRFVIVLFSGDPEIPVLNKVLAQKQFKSAINFVESSISGFIQQNAEPASDHYHLARDIKLQYEQKKISRFRFYLITDYKLSERVRDWPEGQINTIPTDFRIWDIDRLFNVENSTELGSKQ